MNKIKIYIIGIFLTLTIFSCNSQTNNQELIGSWKGSLIDSETGTAIDSLKMEFKKDGKLIYTIGKGNMQNTINMTFRTSNEILYSQEINSKEEDKAKYSINKDTLLLDFEGQTIKLIKIK